MNASVFVRAFWTIVGGGGVGLAVAYSSYSPPKKVFQASVDLAPA